MSPIGIAKIIGGPGSIGFLVLACAIGFLLIYVWPKRIAIGRVWLFGTVLLYAILGCPRVAQSIAASLPAVAAGEVSPARTVDELIVLGGDNEDGRVMETMNAWRTLEPPVVIVLGDRIFAQRIVDAGIPAARIRQNDRPTTTRAQMEWVGTEIRDHQVGEAALIASRLQMPRVMELARMDRLELLFMPSPLDYEPGRTGLRSLLPSYGALELSRDGLYERAALAYYRSRGWIAAEP